ncbi:MAG: ribonuclease H-like domain-containing protein [Nanoarchaeota archaeon]|nr:ribonuclease H-like domain-containing protein [Nanoarchaeota archaeon]
MIRNTFLFLDKIGRRKESLIWQSGIKDWNDFLKTQKINGISVQSKYYYDRKIREAQQALLQENAFYFNGKIPSIERWRLYHYFKENCCFVDIETDSYGRITVVGIADSIMTKHFVRGINFESPSIKNELQKYTVIITFNGSSFDLPKLKKEGLTLHHLHIDLKPLCINLGLKGGLKEVEKILQLKRPAHLYGNPVDLWKSFHASGDREYLDLLLDYNREDCENLQNVMNYVYKEMSNKLYKH